MISAIGTMTKISTILDFYNERKYTCLSWSFLMRDLILEYIDSRWELGYEYEFETTQIDVHLMEDRELLDFYTKLVRKYVE
jgi:hypothetical protein